MWEMDVYTIIMSSVLNLAYKICRVLPNCLDSLHILVARVMVLVCFQHNNWYLIIKYFITTWEWKYLMWIPGVSTALINFCCCLFQVSVTDVRRWNRYSGRLYCDCDVYGYKLGSSIASCLAMENNCNCNNRKWGQLILWRAIL